MTQHQDMTKLCAMERCISCRNDGPCLPAHWPTHRGMGGAKAGWTTEDIVPLCFECHECLDHRNGASGHECLRSDIVTAQVTLHAEEWRERFRDILSDDSEEE